MTGVSVCVFGSQARGEADALSDRDVLIISSSPKKIDLISSNWRERGWNVSAFNREAFSRLADVKSLFVQHIKQESVLLRDDDGFLAAVTRDYSPKHSYLGERNDALRFIKELPIANGNYWFDLCLADICYVHWRNISILQLAARKRYVFDYNIAIDAIRADLQVTEHERLQLHKLRALKHGYRKRVLNLEPQSVVSVAQRLAIRALEEWGHTQESSVASGVTSTKYIELRNAELRLVSRLDPTLLDKLAPMDPLFSTWQSILGAGGYPRPRLN